MSHHINTSIFTKQKAVAIHVLILILILLSTSCTKKQEEVIFFDDSNPLSLAPDVEWALVTDPYAAYRETTDWNSKILNHCRRGEILQFFLYLLSLEKLH